MLRISNHRRFTANHTWHLDYRNERWFVKANPHRDEARAERTGHARLRTYYPVPNLRGTSRIGRWTILFYERWHHLATDYGLLLDEITHADRTGNRWRLDICLTEILTLYRRTIDRTLKYVTNAETISKLYGDRARTGGRVDCYYRPDAPWSVMNEGRRGLRPSQWAQTQFAVNGCTYQMDFDALLTWLRAHFAPHKPVWAAVTQGDPTDVNIGWSSEGGPVWFDYDTGGLNGLPGEFACFLIYQRLHGSWLTPHQAPAAFRDHPAALARASLAKPAVRIHHHGSELVIHYRHSPSPARRHVLRRYLSEIVLPLARVLGIDDLMTWLRPYLVMRLLAVYNLAELNPRETALSVALLAETLDPATRLADLLALTPEPTEAT
ncbi:hypothetical protein ACFPZ0_00525 [Streptomonospora nanhaiensis]|uniref:hypothetical protein n=1 Tax=Streptomonospora nanhaiensis TaxID=1323731 RepID=UPI001C38F65C|nr:hypothetical protein [Streptomonospora nanhaiensis]MBV2366222.1 hypothetical protein [Streptomonospora nanhaiensis]MBX9386955.1 hypothetical protein [Streptomonospora nanhaiensis]